jgi:mRNA-degrading endonuclease YafQ of YafQ-DinJ toxin-antitoxin module
MRIETAKSFLRSLSRRSDAELQQVAITMQETAGSFGLPHSHSGVGIRRLGRNLFECRVGLDLRLLFKAGPGTLTFVFSGNHDDIQAYLRK